MAVRTSSCCDDCSCVGCPDCPAAVRQAAPARARARRAPMRRPTASPIRRALGGMSEYQVKQAVVQATAKAKPALHGFDLQSVPWGAVGALAALYFALR